MTSARTRTTKKQRVLTESEWARVFTARCRSKQGGALSEEERVLCADAFVSDKDRYSAMESDVFDATVPFGSTVRWKRV